MPEGGDVLRVLGRGCDHLLLRRAGCDEMQGYLFAKPAPAKTIDRLLAQAKQHAAAKAGPLPEALTG